MWSKETPTKTGYYWLKLPPIFADAGAVIDLVEVVMTPQFPEDLGKVWYLGDSEHHSVRYLAEQGAEWIPIPLINEHGDAV